MALLGATPMHGDQAPRAAPLKEHFQLNLLEWAVPLELGFFQRKSGPSCKRCHLSKKMPFSIKIIVRGDFQPATISGQVAGHFQGRLCRRSHQSTAQEGRGVRGGEPRQPDPWALPAAGHSPHRPRAHWWGRRGRNGKIIAYIAQMERVYSPPHFLILVV